MMHFSLPTRQDSFAYFWKFISYVGKALSYFGKASLFALQTMLKVACTGFLIVVIVWLTPIVLTYSPLRFPPSYGTPVTWTLIVVFMALTLLFFIRHRTGTLEQYFFGGIAIGLLTMLWQQPTHHSLLLLGITGLLVLNVAFLFYLTGAHIFDAFDEKKLRHPLLFAGTVVGIIACFILAIYAGVTFWDSTIVVNVYNFFHPGR